MGRKKKQRREIPSQDVRRGGGLKRLPEMLTRLLDPAARRRGIASAGLLTEWPAIVGPNLAARCQPIKLGRDRGGPGGVLQLRVGGTAALELQHSEPQLVERINDYFGFPAVARLRLVQAPLPPARRRRTPAARALSPDELAEIETSVATVADEPLRAALAGLGRAVRSSPPPAPDGAAS